MYTHVIFQIHNIHDCITCMLGFDFTFGVQFGVIHYNVLPFTKTNDWYVF